MLIFCPDTNRFRHLQVTNTRFKSLELFKKSLLEIINIKCLILLSEFILKIFKMKLIPATYSESLETEINKQRPA